MAGRNQEKLEGVRDAVAAVNGAAKVQCIQPTTLTLIHSDRQICRAL